MKKKRWRKPAVRTVQQPTFSEEDIQFMSQEAIARRILATSYHLSGFALETGTGNEVRDFAKNFLVGLFHLSDREKFNLESIIDQARDAYEGQKKIDDVERDYLESEILKIRGVLEKLRSNGAEVHKSHFYSKFKTP